MIASLSRRERVLVVLGACVLLLLGAWTFVVQPVRERNRQAAELVPVREQTLARRLELVGRKATIERDLELTRAQIDKTATRFLTAATPAVAASELQKMIKDMAAGASTEVRSERILPPVERAELLEIPVEIAVSGEIRQLVDLLTRVDTASKILTIQDLRIRVVNVTQPRELLATMTVSGYILPAKGKA
jgi:Tfp pilus assembly protein PilO